MIASLLVCSPWGIQGAPGATASPTTIGVEKIRLSEILILTPQPYNEAQVTAAKKRAEDLLAAIRGGKSFSETAMASSEGPTASSGGAMGVYKRGELAPAIDALVFSMQPGEVSDVMRTKQGFAIFKVIERATVEEFREALLPEGTVPDLKDYTTNVRSQIDKIWQARMISSGIVLAKDAELVLSFQVARDGRITKVTLLQSSGNAPLDQVALQAVQSSDPLPAFPAEAKEDHVVIRSIFKYVFSGR